MIDISYVEMQKTKHFLAKHTDIQRMFRQATERVKSVYYTLLVFGSFAKGLEIVTSDLDILIIAPNRQTGEEIDLVLQNEAIFLHRRLQSIVLSETEFIGNLSSKQLNVITESFRNHIIITGIEGFYNGVRQAI